MIEENSTSNAPANFVSLNGEKLTPEQIQKRLEKQQTRCGFSWQEESGSWVRCLNNIGKKHGEYHEHVREHVKVGQEQTVTGFWDGNFGGLSARPTRS